MRSWTLEELHALDHVVEGGVVQQDVDDGDAAVLCGDLVESVDAGGSEFLEVGCVDVDRPPGSAPWLWAWMSMPTMSHRSRSAARPASS